VKPDRSKLRGDSRLRKNPRLASGKKAPVARKMGKKTTVVIKNSTTLTTNKSMTNAMTRLSQYS